MAGSIGHEINNQLAGLMGYLQLYGNEESAAFEQMI